MTLVNWKAKPVLVFWPEYREACQR